MSGVSYLSFFSNDTIEILPVSTMRFELHVRPHIFPKFLGSRLLDILQDSNCLNK